MVVTTMDMYYAVSSANFLPCVLRSEGSTQDGGDVLSSLLSELYLNFKNRGVSTFAFMALSNTKTFRKAVLSKWEHR